MELYTKTMQIADWKVRHGETLRSWGRSAARTGEHAAAETTVGEAVDLGWATSVGTTIASQNRDLYWSTGKSLLEEAGGRAKLDEQLPRCCDDV